MVASSPIEVRSGALNLQGSLIAGKYRLVSLLGEGGMGSVWRAEHLGLNAPVAVKLLNQVVAASSDGLGRFHREAQAAAALRSPHVVQIFDHGVDPVSQQPFIVMELMEGESLASRLAREGRLPPEQTARVITHISRALARAHEAGIVHRDLKPDNVFLVQNEDEEIAKVLDFGIAKTQANQLGPGSATRTGAVMGTPYYMSPEQISGSKSVDFRTDLWALTIIAFECLSGRPRRATRRPDSDRRGRWPRSSGESAAVPTGLRRFRQLPNPLPRPPPWPRARAHSYVRRIVASRTSRQGRRVTANGYWPAVHHSF
jgi:serine/threonine protein kinase